MGISKQLCLIFLLLTIGACDEPELKKEMVQFDRAFIPAYYYTYVGNIEEAQKAMIPLNRKWQQFKHHYATPIRMRDDWNESLNMVDAWLTESNVALSEKNTFRAAAQLDHARYEMMDLRWREGLDYYLDYVWDLEGSIGAAIDVSTDPMLELLSWKEFYAISQTVLEAWQVLEKQPIDLELFELDQSNESQLALRKERLGSGINDFLAAVDCADACKFSEAALQLERVYLDFVRLFGDFESTETFYARIN